MRVLVFLLIMSLALLHTKPLFVAAAEEGDGLEVSTWEKMQTETKTEELKHGDTKDSLIEAVEELAALEEEERASAGLDAAFKTLAAAAAKEYDDQTEGLEYDPEPEVNRECKGLGYIFCESLQRCVKSWKETCPSIDEAVAALREMEENFEGGDYQKEEWYINAVLPAEDDPEEDHADALHEGENPYMDHMDHDHDLLELEAENEMMET